MKKSAICFSLLLPKDVYGLSQYFIVFYEETRFEHGFVSRRIVSPNLPQRP